MWCSFLLVLLFSSICYCDSRIHTLDENTFVSTISSVDFPWLVLFRGSKIADKELSIAIERIAKTTFGDPPPFQVAVVECWKSEFCKDGFGMEVTPWLVLFNNGVWSPGTTWEYNTDSPSSWSATENNIEMIRDFALGQYRLKAVEHHPFKLRYDPSSIISKLMSKITIRRLPSISRMSEIFALRKNAALAFLLIGITIGWILSRMIF